MSKLVIKDHDYAYFEYDTFKQDAIADIYYRGYLRFKDTDEEKAARFLDKWWNQLVTGIVEMGSDVCFLDGLYHTRTTLTKDWFECEMYRLLLATKKFVQRYEKYIPRFEKTARRVEKERPLMNRPRFE